MRILFLASFNKHRFAPFIVEQADALRRAGCEVDFFGVQGKGVKGYLKALPLLKQRIKAYHPDVIHAHYGLCGLLAGLQRRVPVVTTYHGSDINVKKNRLFSRIAMMLSQYNIFVSKKTLKIASPKKKYAFIPCGIDLMELQLTEKAEARKRMGLNADGQYVLFAGAFDNTVKNAPLAREAMRLIPEAELLELKGYTREQVTLLMCAVDAFLMTSFSEGSPQVIKEAMACGCPIVSVDVGDVAERTEGVEGCCIVGRTAEDIAEKLRSVLARTERTKGRERILALGLTNDLIAQQLVDIYTQITGRHLIDEHKN